ncbi:MAG: hypothetical protein QM695_00325 [Micropruina sp.]
MSRSLARPSALVVAAATLLCLTSACAAPQPSASLPPASTAPASQQVSVSAAAPTSSQSPMPGLQTARPPQGQAVLVDGPFNDRFHIDGLAFDGARVTGTVVVTSDVSEIIDLQVQVGFHDASGALLGTASFDHHGQGHDESEHASHSPEDHPSSPS